MKNTHMLLAATLTAITGCGAPGGGGSVSGELSNAVSAAEADFAVLDIASHTFSYLTSAPAVTSDAAYRTTKIVFRRIQVGSSDVFVGVFELTQAQWTALDAIATTPWTSVPALICSAAAQTADRPAYNLDKDSVTTVLAAYAITGGAQLSVPTTAQWEVACGTTTGWWWGQTATDAQLLANAVVRESVIDSTRLRPGAVYQDGVDTGGPLVVGSRAANALGFYDIHGNVWELVSTTTGTQAFGGSWRDSAWASRAEVRPGSTEGMHAQLDHALVGVRLVLTP